MAERDMISNMGLSDDARVFDRTAQVPLPLEGTVLWLMPYAPFPFKVLQIHYWIDGGDLEMTPKIDATPINTDQTDTTGVITVDQPSRQEATPDDPDEPEANRTVEEGQALSLVLENVSSNANGLVVQVWCQRTEEKVIKTI